MSHFDSGKLLEFHSELLEKIDNSLDAIELFRAHIPPTSGTNDDVIYLEDSLNYIKNSYVVETCTSINNYSMGYSKEQATDEYFICINSNKYRERISEVVSNLVRILGDFCAKLNGKKRSELALALDKLATANKIKLNLMLPKSIPIDVCDCGLRMLMGSENSEYFCVNCNIYRRNENMIMPQSADHLASASQITEVKFSKYWYITMGIEDWKISDENINALVSTIKIHFVGKPIDAKSLREYLRNAFPNSGKANKSFIEAKHHVAKVLRLLNHSDRIPSVSPKELETIERWFNVIVAQNNSLLTAGTEKINLRKWFILHRIIEIIFRDDVRKNDLLSLLDFKPNKDSIMKHDALFLQICNAVKNIIPIAEYNKK